MAIEFIDFFGLKLSIVKRPALYEEIKNTIIDNRKLVIYGYSLGTIKILNKFPIMYTFGWEHADIMMVDGRGLYLLGKLLKFPFQDDISIPELSTDLLKLANTNKYSIYFLGTKKEINLAAQKHIEVNYKGIQVLGGTDGFFTKDDEEDIVNQINRLKPNILYVGISSPKKEDFISRWKEQLDTNIILLCGGVIDIIAGDKKQTPKWLKKIGGAPIYRFIQEPVRLYKYLFPFIFFLLFQFLPVLLFKRIFGQLNKFSIPKFCKIDKII